MLVKILLIIVVSSFLCTNKIKFYTFYVINPYIINFYVHQFCTFIVVSKCSCDYSVCLSAKLEGSAEIGKVVNEV